MGLENRDYLRDDYDPPTRRFSAPTLTVLGKLIAVTVAVFVLQLLTATNIETPLGIQRISVAENWLELGVREVFQSGQVWRLLTYAFCHNRLNLLHLVMNMLGLYFAGRMVLSVVSEREFLWFYLASAVWAGIISLVFCSFFKPQAHILGASGATLAVLTLAAMYYPRQEVLLMGILPLQMRWLLLLYVALDVLPLLSGQWRQSTTAHTAHLGGVLFGFLYFRWDMQITRWWDQAIRGIRLRRKNRGNLKIYAPNTQPESSLDEQVDRILQKISEQGEASLTARERNILTQASRQLRKNRS